MAYTRDCESLKLKLIGVSRPVEIQSGTFIGRREIPRTKHGFPGVSGQVSRGVWHAELIYRSGIIISVPTGCRSTNRESPSRLSLLPSVRTNVETRDMSLARKSLTGYSWQRSIDEQPAKRKDIRSMFRYIWISKQMIKASKFNLISIKFFCDYYCYI